MLCSLTQLDELAKRRILSLVIFFSLYKPQNTNQTLYSLFLYPTKYFSSRDYVPLALQGIHSRKFFVLTRNKKKIVRRNILFRLFSDPRKATFSSELYSHSYVYLQRSWDFNFHHRSCYAILHSKEWIPLFHFSKKEETTKSLHRTWIPSSFTSFHYFFFL